MAQSLIKPKNGETEDAGKIRREFEDWSLQSFRLEEIEDVDDLLKVLAEWRRSVNREWDFNRNNSKWENNRSNIKKAELRDWIDELVDLIPDGELRSCGSCGSEKMPRSNRRKKIGYEWECLDCSI
jgi:hypothetical protein